MNPSRARVPLANGWPRAIACALVAAVLVAAAPAHADEPLSIHQLELQQHQGEPLAARILPTAPLRPRDSKLERVVYGYYPFWVADLSTIRWSALTHLAWFSVDLNSQGQVVSAHGWPDDDVVQVAHAAGVRVDLTFTLFGNAAVQALCTSPTRRASTIATMVDRMEDGGADGISVDFEFVNAATRDAFVAFIHELRAELDARGHTDAEISIAGPAVDWSNAIDLDALLDAADWFFVMGYGYFWSGSAHAGPLGMLRVTSEWAPYQSRSMERTIADYSRLIDADKRHQIVWGVPYYGRDWSTSSGQLGASTLANNGAVTYSQAVSDLTSAGVDAQFAAGVENPWNRWQNNGTWHQVWYDDAASLAAKYQLALDQDLGGVGIWALNYDKPHSELWDLLEQSFAGLPDVPEGHRLAPIAIDAFPFHDARNTSEGASHYFNYYSCDPSVPEFGREWVYRIDVCQPGNLMASVPEYADRDPDLQLLSAPDQDACLERAHTDLAADVEPGRYFLVVDSYVDMPVALEGAYDLDVDFVPKPGTVGCAAYLRCDAGSCVCPGAAELECGDRCVDPSSDAEHCGGCGLACAAGEQCVAGSCQASETPEPEPTAASDVPAPPDDGGCGCRSAGSRPPRWGAWLLALVAVCGLGRRRATRRRPRAAARVRLSPHARRSPTRRSARQPQRS